MQIRKAVLVLALAAFALAPAQASAQTAVDVKLSLLVDVSGSVSCCTAGSEFDLQNTAYANAFKNGNVWNAIAQGPLKRIAVNYIFWSSSQAVAVNWTLIDSNAAAVAFGNAIDAYNSPNISRANTFIGDALAFGTNNFGNAAGQNYTSVNNVIDISGDGCNNGGTRSSAQGRAYALANGVDRINGLVIQPNNPCGFGNSPEPNVLAHYQAQVVGGAGSFVSVANDFDDFETAIEQKMIQEITGVPEPSTIILLGTGLLGLGGMALRRRSEDGEDEA